MTKKALKIIEKTILSLDYENAGAVAKAALERGIDPNEIIKTGTAAMQKIGELFAKEELFIPEVLLAADAMKEIMKVLKPKILAGKIRIKPKGRIVLGTVEGDIHDIGLSLVATMLECAGFQVHVLGNDIPVKTFVEKVKELKPDILGMSAMMTVTMDRQKDVIELLKKMGTKGKVKVMVGGAPVTSEFAERIGADGYGADADEAVKLADKLMKKKSGGL